MMLNELQQAPVVLMVLEVHPDEVRVLFTEVDMSGSMDGMALATQVLARRAVRGP